jgi:hypothetical protein
MNCPICKNEMTYVFSEEILKKHNVKYFQCGHCDMIKTEAPFWLKEAYASPINETDIGIIERNVIFSKVAFVIFGSLYKKDEIFLDYAGGYGMLTRLMRNYGFNFLHSDPFTENIFARGHQYHGTEKITAMTCFECFEHIENSMAEIEKMLKISDTILFSTTLFKRIPPKTWDYYGFDHGQHISFYSKRTLSEIAQKYELNLYTNGKNIHLFTRRKISRARFMMLTLTAKFLMLVQLDFFFKKYES